MALFICLGIDNSWLLSGMIKCGSYMVKLPLWHLGPNGSPTPLPINILPSSETNDRIDSGKNNSEPRSSEIYRTIEGKYKLTCMICYGTFIPPWMPISRVILQNSKVDLIIPWQQDTNSCEQEDDHWWLRNQTLCWWDWGFALLIFRKTDGANIVIMV